MLVLVIYKGVFVVCEWHLYISKSLSVVFIVTTLLLSHISGHIIYLFPTIAIHYFKPQCPFYLFISALLSTLMSLFIYPFLFLLFLLFLSPFYYSKYVILSPILYIFSHMKNVITFSLSLFHVLFLCEFLFFVSKL